MSTYGVISAGKTRYCLVPNDRSAVQDMPLFLGGPSARSFGWDQNTREVITPRGERVAGTRVVLEDELWTPGDLLVVLGHGPNKHLPVCPLSLGFMRQPPELLAQVLAQLSVAMTNVDAVFHLSWDGIFCQRKYKTAMLPVGVAAWPPKEIPDWRPHFLLFGPGTKEAQGTAPFKRFAPVVYGDGAGWPQGECRIYEDGYLAMVRTEGAPRLVGFVDPKASDPTSLGFSLMGPGSPDVSFLGLAEWAERVLLSPVVRSGSTSEELRVAIDFGTSNTAVAIRSGKDAPRLLTFDNGGAATIPTTAIGLDPYSYTNTPFRFFPTGVRYTNPLPTMLLDILPTDRQAAPFSGSRSLPRFLIPPPKPLFDEDGAQHFSRNKLLKQDFKWLGDDADVLRRAFLEQFALLVAYELRCELASLPQRLILTGSYPLAYSPEQHSRLIDAFSEVQRVFEHGGFPHVELEELISESYANYLFVDDQYKSLHRNETGRLLVVDIGGGTTDISVSTESGQVLFLDSLMIGGKDLSQKLLPYRILEQDRSDQVLKALNLRGKPGGRSDKGWCDALQYILIRKMKEGDGVRDLRKDFQQNGMSDLLGELLALLTFATVYGARLALQPDPSKVKRLTVKFGGLGSRLFDMAPLAPPHARAWETAKHVLLGVIKGLPEAAGVTISMDRFPEPKEAVCLGTSLAGSRAQGALEPRIKLRTIWWSDIPRGDGNSIAWNSNFNPGAAKGFTDDEVDGAEVKPLLQLVEATVGKVGEVTFGEGWRPKEEQVASLRSELPGFYRNGCSRLREEDGTGKLTHWPIRQLTEGLKEILCAVIE